MFLIFESEKIAKLFADKVPYRALTNILKQNLYKYKFSWFRDRFSLKKETETAIVLSEVFTIVPVR